MVTLRVDPSLNFRLYLRNVNLRLRLYCWEKMNQILVPAAGAVCFRLGLEGVLDQAQISLGIMMCLDICNGE